MGVENSPNRIKDLVASWPQDNEKREDGAAHLRNIKGALQGSFPSLGAAAVTVTAEEINAVTSKLRSFNGRSGPDILPQDGDYDLGELGDVDTAGASQGDNLVFNGAKWVPQQGFVFGSAHFTGFNNATGSVVGFDTERTDTITGKLGTIKNDTDGWRFTADRDCLVFINYSYRRANVDYPQQVGPENQINTRCQIVKNDSGTGLIGAGANLLADSDWSQDWENLLSPPYQIIQGDGIAATCEMAQGEFVEIRSGTTGNYNTCQVTISVIGIPDIENVTPPDVGGTPDENTPPGHWATANTNDSISEVETQILAASPNIQGVQIFLNWADVDEGTGSNPSYNFDICRQYINLCASYGKRCVFMLRWKTFNSGQPLPVWLDRGANQSLNANGGYSCHMDDITVTNAYISMMTQAAAELAGLPGFGGLVIQESAIGLEPGNPSGWDQTQYEINLEDIAVNAANLFPNYNIFWFLNYNNSDVNRTGYIYDMVISARGRIGNDNLIIAGPDIFTHADGLSQAYSNQISDGIYATMYRLDQLNDGVRFANSMQNDSYRIDPSNEDGKWYTCYPLPPGEAGPFYPMGQSGGNGYSLFDWALDLLKCEFIFWTNRRDTGTNNYQTHALATMNNNPSWNRRTNIIGSSNRKTWDAGAWSEEGVLASEIVEGTFDGQEMTRSGLNSWAVLESGNAKHQFRLGNSGQLPASQFVVGETYTLELSFKQDPGTLRDVRLEMTKADGLTRGTTFEGATGSVLQHNAQTWRATEQKNGYWLYQADFIPRASDLETGDVVIRFKLMDGTSDTYDAAGFGGSFGLAQLYRRN